MNFIHIFIPFLFSLIIFFILNKRYFSKKKDEISEIEDLILTENDNENKNTILDVDKYKERLYFLINTKITNLKDKSYKTLTEFDFKEFDNLFQVRLEVKLHEIKKSCISKNDLLLFEECQLIVLIFSEILADIYDAFYFFKKFYNDETTSLNIQEIVEKIKNRFFSILNIKTKLDQDFHKSSLHQSLIITFMLVIQFVIMDWQLIFKELLRVFFPHNVVNKSKSYCYTRHLQFIDSINLCFETAQLSLKDKE